MRTEFYNVPFSFRRTIRRLYAQAEKTLKLADVFEVAVSFIPDEEMRALNNRTRSVDRVTDVLSFPAIVFKDFSDRTLFDADVNPETCLYGLGDVVICLGQARRQAEEYGHSAKREVGFLALHGLLHLLGYDHVTADDEKVMTALQNKILSECKINR